MKQSKLVDDFLAKINGGANNLRRTETALSGSLKDDSKEDLRDSYMSHLKQSKSRKSMIESKSDDHSSQDKASNSHQRIKEMSDSRSMNRYATLVLPAHDDQISGLDLGNSFNKKYGTFSAKKRNFSHEPHTGVNFARVTKKDLVPPSNKYH